MAISLLQSNATASAAASPTSITPTLGSPSTAGTLLVLAVAATGSAPSITSPGAGWVAFGNSAPGNLARALFYMLNNPGGITSVPVTVSAATGGAAASIFEFSGVGIGAILEFSNAPANTNGAFANPYTSNVPLTNELWFCAVHFQAGVLTPTTTPEWSAAVGAAVSTNGTPNAQIACFWAVNSSSNNPAISGTVSSNNWAVRALRFQTGASNGISNDNIGGLAGQLVGQFYQGMIGG